MDWAIIFKDYPLLIPALATVLAAILGFFFVRWNSTHNTNLEFRKKEYDRRAAIYDKRIQEARDYLENLEELFTVMAGVIRILLASNDINDTREQLANSDEQVNQMSTIYVKITKRILSILALEDEKLNSLQAEVMTILFKHNKLLDDTVIGILEGRITSIDKDVFRSMSDLFIETQVTILYMKRRIDTLAQKIPNKKSPF